MLTATINPARFDCRLAVLPSVQGRDAIGGVVEQGGPAATLHAEQVSETSRAFTSAQARHTELDAVFRVRHRNDLVPGCRLRHSDGRTFEVLAQPTEEGRRQYLLVACRILNPARLA